MSWFRNLLISLGAYLLSYFLVFFIAWPLNMVTNGVIYGDSVTETIARGVMTSMARAVCAGLGAAIVMFFATGAKPQRWAWVVALLYAARLHTHWYAPPTSRDRLWQSVDLLWPAIVCIAVAAIIARLRRNSRVATNTGVTGKPL